jgi:hypothetical protein
LRRGLLWGVRLMSVGIVRGRIVICSKSNTASLGFIESRSLLISGFLFVTFDDVEAVETA